MKMASDDAYRAQLKELLRAIRHRTLGLQAAAGMVSFVALAAWVYLAVVVWTAAANEPALWKTTMVSRSAFVVLAGLFAYFVVWPLLRVPGVDALASEVERRKDLRELLRAGYEFSNDAKAKKRYSPALVDEVVRRAVRSIEGLQVKALFLERKDAALMPVAYGGLVIVLLISLFNPGLLTSAGRTVAAPASVSAVDHRANIHVSPGDVTVLAGTDVTVAGLDFGRTEDAVTVSYNLSEDFWKTEPTALVSGEDLKAAGGAPINRYEYRFTDLRHSVSYYFESGDFKSDTYTLNVVHKPILIDLDVTLTPPSYTGEPQVTLNDNGGNVQALEGTTVEVTGTANNYLRGAWVKFDGGEKQEVSHDGHRVEFEFQALADGHYSVVLEDTIGYATDDPLLYTIEVYKDHAPSLDVLEPGMDTQLPRNKKLAIGFIAADDYGVRAASVYHRMSGERDYKRIPIPLAGQRDKKEIAVAWEWELTDLQLFPGNYVEYFVQVSDNNVVTGPGVTRSRTYQIMVPTMAEVYDRVREEEARRGDLFDQAIKQNEEFRERLEKITREYIKTEKMEWTQKKEFDKALDQQKAVEETLDDIKKSLDDTMKELADNQMTSQEIGEKLEEIQQLLEEIDSEELREYMEELKESVDKLSPEDIKEALENIDLTAQDMLEKLERTASLLKQIQQEQKMEEMVRKSQDLMQEQKDLADETSDSEAGDQEKMNDLSGRQEDLARKADDLKNAMEEFAGEMQESDQNVAQQMSDASEKLDQKSGPQNNMRQAARDLEMSRKPSAMQQQQQAMDKLIALFQQTQQAQGQMQFNSGQRAAKNFQKYAKQTLDLSFKQEKLAGQLQTDKRSELTSDYQQLAQTQNSYLKATQKVADEIVKMAGMTLMVPRDLMEALGAAIERMQSSVLFLEQNRPFMSTAHATNAVESLNEATIEMLRSAKQCSQSGGSGQMTAQQMLQQMIPQQQDILQQTRSLMELQATGERLRQERQSQLDRLAEQQRTLKELAEQIQKSMDQNRELLGRLDKTVDEMESVSKSIERGEVDPDLVRREQRILSRMLDAQRSVHTRDYEQKRESVTAEDIFSRSLGENPDGPDAQSLRDEIRKAMQLKVPGEFEDLIKLYFRALAEESASPAGNS
ncbi:MAG: DUF4175 family protein [Candidatus Latescibacterota bacterium]|jgi:hypothetical protein